MKFFTILACLAGSSMAKDAISQALFDRITYYATFAAAATIANPCTTPPDNFVVERQLNTDASWTNTSATLFRKDSRRELILAFAASNNSVNNQNNLDANLQPLNNNFRCGDAFNTCKIHGGLQRSYGSATDSRDMAYMVRAAIRSALNTYSGYTLTLVGPSLGGALASQAFLDLSQFYNVGSVWTYGEPRVGNGALVDLVERTAGASYSTPGKYYRITHYDDGVVKLPAPGPIGPDQYQHSLTEYWHSKEECSTRNTAATTFRCYGREDPQCNYGQPPTGRTITNHGQYPGYANVRCANRFVDTTTC